MRNRYLSNLELLGGLLLVSTLQVAQEPPMVPRPTQAQQLLDKVMESPSGWHYALQEALDEEPTLEVESLRHELKTTLGGKPAVASKAELRAVILLHIARIRDIKEAGPELESALGFGHSESIRYELAWTLATLEPETARATQLLASRDDAFVAGAIEAVGDRDDDVLERRLDELLGQHERYQGTLTGNALSHLELKNEHEEWWTASTSLGERLDFLLDRAGEMFLPVPSPCPAPVRSDELPARWLRRRLRQLYDQDAETALSRLKARLATDSLRKAHLEALLKELAG